MEMITTIQLNKKLKQRLDSLKIHHRETYNELITRLISNSNPQNFDKESLIETIAVLSDPETMKNIKQALEEEQRGEKGTSLEDFEKELGL